MKYKNIQCQKCRYTYILLNYWINLLMYLQIITHKWKVSQSLCVSSKDWSSKCILLYLWCSKDAHQEIEEEKRKTENLQKYVLIAILFFAVKTLNMFVTKFKTTSYTLQRKQRIVRRLWKKEGTVKKVGEYHCLWKKKPSDKYSDSIHNDCHFLTNGKTFYL